MAPPGNDGPSLTNCSGPGPGLEVPERKEILLATLGEVTRLLWRFAMKGVRPVAFWGAVLLPLVYLPSLYGLGTGRFTPPAITLVTVHILTIVVGHRHTPFWSD